MPQPDGEAIRPTGVMMAGTERLELYLRGRGAAAIVLIALLLLLQGCSEPAGPRADVVYQNGQFYTLNDLNPWADSLAVRDGLILAAGDAQAISDYVGVDTRRVDLGGRFVMPGIHDMHMHPLKGGIKETLECSFASSLNMAEILTVVAECANRLPSGEWLRGGQWPSHLLKSTQPPTRELLDAITTEHPIFLLDWAVHNAWLNSKALELLGIDDNTPDPEGGEILRDPVTGKATGVLLDNAAYQAQARLPAYSEAQNVAALTNAIEQFLALGITSFKDAITTTDALKAYQVMDEEGLLNARVYTALAWKSSWSVSHEEERRNIEARASYASPLVTTDFVKIMLDGVPLTRTSAMLEPYLGDGEHGSDFAGELMFEPEVLKADVAWLDAQGLSVKIHATGDRSARVALDAIEFARTQNGVNGPWHEISHAQFISDRDVPRFSALNVAAEMCPILWYPTASDAARAAVLGAERAQRMWPMRRLLDSGAAVFYGSDWPAVVPTPSPWPGIEAMVTRRNPYTNDSDAQWPEQAITLEEALRLVTINGAATVGQADRTGSLAPGKAADFIVLDANPFEIPIEAVSELQVELTVLGGAVVHETGAVEGGVP
ncbi:MAG: amidohydrolase [Cellvibrionales bacterium]